MPSAGIERDRARREEARLAADLQARFESLTPRERQIMAMGVTGEQNKQIAHRSENSSKSIAATSCKKCGLKSVAELVRPRRV